MFEQGTMLVQIETDAEGATPSTCYSSVSVSISLVPSSNSDPTFIVVLRCIFSLICELYFLIFLFVFILLLVPLLLLVALALLVPLQVE
jgi:hypothetical protein